MVLLESADFYQEAATWFVRSAQQAIGQRGIFSVALSGGSTPRSLYELLARPQFSRRIQWDKVHVFWGDERCVPPDDPVSNFRMTSESLLDHVAIPSDHVHRIRGELDPTLAAQEYELTLRSLPTVLPMEINPRTGVEFPRFDLILLGLGEDGHTASLFPDTAALRSQERLVVANWVEKLESWRVTQTLPVINTAAEIMFLVSGSQKAQILQQVLQGPNQPGRLPAQNIDPWNGSLVWLVDQQAGTMLE
jgi:6-phosphogluconolactonase